MFFLLFIVRLLPHKNLVIPSFSLSNSLSIPKGNRKQKD